MTIIAPTEGIRSVKQKGKIGDYAEYGKVWYGHALYGKSFEEAGIYQMRTCKIGNPTPGTVYHYAKRPIRMKFYGSPGAGSEAQAAAQSAFANAVAAYQSLTTEQKKVYHTNAVGEHFTGYNLFLREYMLSH